MLPVAWGDCPGIKLVGRGLKMFLHLSAVGLPAICRAQPLTFGMSKGLTAVLTAGLPNQLTALRFLMGILFLLALSGRLFDLALGVFLLALLTDFLDGYLARKKGLVSNFGRIADPLADKIIICGGLTFLLCRAPHVIEGWMVAAIVGRELVITALRGYAELRGLAFPSNIWGKMKMAAQSITLCLLLFGASHWEQGGAIMKGVQEIVWFTVIVTAFSGLIYLYNAWHLRIRCVEIDKEPYGLL